MQMLERAIGWGLMLLSASLFTLSTSKLTQYPRKILEQEIEVVLPRFIQVGMAGGDRFLAANVGVLRTLLNPTARDDYDHYVAQARIQSDVAWFNPRHEDNYYIAAAMLSWSGHVAEAENILEKATISRSFDMLPPFFLGFDYFYFDQNPGVGSKWMYVAATRADAQNRISLSRIAARWAERETNAQLALNMVRVMRNQAQGLVLKQYLDARIKRLEGLIALQEVAEKYKKKYGHAANGFKDLLITRMIDEIPSDPLGIGYAFDDNGVPQLIQSQSRTQSRAALSK